MSLEGPKARFVGLVKRHGTKATSTLLLKFMPKTMSGAGRLYKILRVLKPPNRVSLAPAPATLISMLHTRIGLSRVTQSLIGGLSG